MELLLETFDYEEGDFLFLSRLERFSSFSSFQPLHNLSLMMYSVFFSLSTFLFGEGFATFALPTTFSAGSSGESLALPYSFRSVLLSEFFTGRIKFG